jgi:hypothetical protein
VAWKPPGDSFWSLIQETSLFPVLPDEEGHQFMVTMLRMAFEKLRRERL